MKSGRDEGWVCKWKPNQSLIPQTKKRSVNRDLNTVFHDMEINTKIIR